MTDSAPITLSERDEAIAQRTAALVLAQLRSAQLSQVLTETINAQELQQMLGSRSRTATYRIAKRLCIRPYALGRYRLKHVQDRIARASYAAASKANAKTAA